MITIPPHLDILAVAERSVGRLTRKATTNTGEYAGACFLCGGRDRLLLWPLRPREDGPTWWCRQCHEHGDIIDLVRLCEGVSFREALEILEIEESESDIESRYRVSISAHDIGSRYREPSLPASPSKAWQERALALSAVWKKKLQQSSGILDYLRGRGLTDETINRFDLGYNEADWFDMRTNWGLPVYETEKVKIPRGITIPYTHNGAIWKINVRLAVPSNGSKYWAIRGSQETIFNLHSVKDGKPVVIVESELDAVSGYQEAKDMAVFVATSGTAKMYPQHIPALERASSVLVAFDADAAGDTGSAYWLQHIPKAMRYEPWGHDLNDMLKAGVSIREWLETGLALAECDVEIDKPDARQEFLKKLDEHFALPNE